jgi:hypothetical protein
LVFRPIAKIHLPASARNTPATIPTIRPFGPGRTAECFRRTSEDTAISEFQTAMREAMPHAHLPVCEHRRGAARNPCDPACRSAWMAAQLACISARPGEPVTVQLSHRRAIIAPVVTEPLLRSPCQCIEADSSFEPPPEWLWPLYRRFLDLPGGTYNLENQTSRSEKHLMSDFHPYSRQFFCTLRIKFQSAFP